MVGGAAAPARGLGGPVQNRPANAKRRQNIGDIGGIVPPGDPAALAEAMHRVLVLSPDQRHALGAAARARIVERFGLDAMVAGTEAALLAVLTARGAPTRAATLPKTTPFSEGRPG